MISTLIALVFCLLPKALTAQCDFGPISAISYYSGECHEKDYQILTGMAIPIYGDNGTLFFTSPLTSHALITSVIASLELEYNIYPNPVLSNLHIDWPNPEKVEVFIYSQLGQEIQKFSLEANSFSTLDVHDLQTGFYVLIFKTNNHKTFSKKLIKI